MPGMTFMHGPISIKHKPVLDIENRYLSGMTLCLSDIIPRTSHMWLRSIPDHMVLYLTKWPVSFKINVEKDEMQLKDNLHQGFVELCNDGETSSLRIFYLEHGEGRLERECTQISGLERAEDCSSLVFRICRLKSGIDCNECICCKDIASNRLSARDNHHQQSVVQKRTLVKQLSKFQQISVTHQAYVARYAPPYVLLMPNRPQKLMELGDLIKWKNSRKVVPQHVKNWNQKRKPFTSTEIYLCSPSKRFTHEPQKEANSILLDPLTKQHPEEPLKEGVLEINNITVKSNSLAKKITNLDDAFSYTHSRQSTSDLSKSFERLSAGTDAVSPKG
ncbi:hypothetical protein LOAG_17075 [Loa loa]|uniref:Uncharacterized protein n=1 Tax=Loa loa TaxID=7209 RepID=A0A1S0UK05_LOALO|nr:hypothetical protein LOAG_17075 [Loa loa]EJD75863.1 hypothetical protein LOAG_17075 [Loa loa]